MEYVIGSGYYAPKPEYTNFYSKYWLPNTYKYTEAARIVIVNSGFDVLEKVNSIKEQWINLSRNIGHIREMRKVENPDQFCGWTLSFLNSALYAYSCGCDFIYKEQDCLAFGNWVKRIYSYKVPFAIGTLYDFPKRSYLLDVCLFYLRHDFIIEFISKYMSINVLDVTLPPEAKFIRIYDDDSTKYKLFDFGYGGGRPFNAKDEVFYVQKPRWDYERKRHLVYWYHNGGLPQKEMDMLQQENLL